MDVAEFDFELPEDLIALRPAQPRDAARMLVVRADGGIEHAQVRDLPRYLRSGDGLVVNDTRVIPARLRGVRTGRATEPKVELLLYRKTGDGQFLAFARPARKLEVGDGVRLAALSGRVISKPDSGSVELQFDLQGAAFDAALAAEGEMPLPPYIAGRRKADARDAADYQTTFARRDGSVAAPTAGLHLTPELFARLRAAGVARETVTLHVGPGTFLPVTAGDTAQHRMHAEWAELAAGAAARLNAVRAAGGRIVPVGTTSLRTLESAANAEGTLAAMSRETDIFITPGYRFRAADVLLTNFHLPRSTLFMLVSAFIGLEKARAVYAKAIRERYRFYSYGDACLLFRQP
jgi:S-adenosylmethionine:tRNA ribosyltransferase-isomerase